MIRSKSAGGEISREVTRLAGPAIAQQLLLTLVFLADRAMLGRYGGDSLASMQLSGPLVWATYSILGSFTVGSVALIGRRIGGGDPRAASAALRASLAFALVLGFTVLLVGAPSADFIVSLFGGVGEAARNEAAAYLAISFGAMPCILFAYTAAVCLQAAGDTRSPFLIAAVGNVINVALNAVLIFGAWGIAPMGAAGAAWASAASMLWQCLALAWVLRVHPRLRWTGRGGERDAWRAMVRVSTASLAERGLQHVGYLGFVAMIAALGSTAMAANQALISVESIVFLSGDGFGIAAAAIVAQRLGADRPDDARAGLAAALKLALACLCVAALAFIVAPRPLLELFSADAHIVALGVPCMRIAAVAAPFMGAGIVMSAALRGAGDTRTALAVMVLSGLGVRLGATWLFAFHFELGLVGVWLGSTTDWIVRTILLGTRVARDAWTRVAV